jgi:hypothetical protein
VLLLLLLLLLLPPPPPPPLHSDRLSRKIFNCK